MVCEEGCAAPHPTPVAPGTHQHFAIDALGQRQPLEDLAEELEHLRRVLGFHLALEAVDLVHVVRLVVTWTVGPEA